MKETCSTGGCSIAGCRFCPCPVNFVAGLIMFAAGIMKVFMGWTGPATFMWTAALGLLGLDGANLGVLPVILGSIAILIEIIGGFSFMIGCCKTSKYAAVALMIVSGVIMILDIQKGMGWGFFKALQGAQFTILFFTVFANRGIKTLASCCGMSCGSCCNTEMKK